MCGVMRAQHLCFTKDTTMSQEQEIIILNIQVEDEEDSSMDSNMEETAILDSKEVSTPEQLKRSGLVYEEEQQYPEAIEMRENERKSY